MRSIVRVWSWVSTPSILATVTRRCFVTRIPALRWRTAQYFRLRIQNVGWRTAEDVEVTLEGVERFHDGQFALDIQFMPLRLFWSHWREHRFELSIPPGTYRHCDLGFVLDPAAPMPPLRPCDNNQLQFWFDVFSRPNTGRTSLLPGRYRFTVSAFGRDVTIASRTIEVTWNGIWHDSFSEMLRDSLLFHAGFDTVQ